MIKFLFQLVLITTLCFAPSSSKSQEVQQPEAKKNKGTFYFGWGYNKDWFTKSNIHFKNTSNEYNPFLGINDNYDFTIYKAKAKDRPGFKDILRTDLTIPQYVYRIGYYLNDKHDLGIEINFDHVKYVMIDNQTLHVKGNIHGKYIDKDTLIDDNHFLQFEHSDGANFLMINLMKRFNLLSTLNLNHRLFAIVKPGAGIVVPKTRVNLFGEVLDNRFHIAGYCLGIEAGFRYEAFKHIYLEYTAKGAFANYLNVLVIGSGRAKHHFGAFENILVLGLHFPI